MSIEDQIKALNDTAHIAAQANHIVSSSMFDGGAAVFLAGAAYGTGSVPAAKASLRQLFYSFVRTYGVFMKDDGPGKTLPPEEVFAEVLAGTAFGLARYCMETGAKFDEVIPKAEAILQKKFKIP